MKMLKAQDVFSYPRFLAKKVAPTRIRPFIEDDVQNVNGEFLQDARGTFFWDLEQRRQRVEIGRCLLVGTSPQDRWTTSTESVVRDRVAIGPADEDGFRLYVIKDPTSLTCFDINHAFSFDPGDGTTPWICENPAGGYIVWNGIADEGSTMRVVQRPIFNLTYERV